MTAGVLWASGGASERDQLKISTNVVPDSLCRLSPPTRARVLTPSGLQSIDKPDS